MAGDAASKEVNDTALVDSALPASDLKAEPSGAVHRASTPSPSSPGEANASSGDSDSSSSDSDSDLDSDSDSSASVSSGESKEEAPWKTEGYEDRKRANIAAFLKASMERVEINSEKGVEKGKDKAGGEEGEQEGKEEEEDVIKLDADDADVNAKVERLGPLPKLDPGALFQYNLPSPYLSRTPSSSAANGASPEATTSTSESRKDALSSTRRAQLSEHDKQVDRFLDQLESGERINMKGEPLKSKGQMKREKMAAKASTAGKNWFDMPAFPADSPSKPGESSSSTSTSYGRGPTAEEMRREVQALRLRNSLDPKRFYKGGVDKGMPKFAQLGKILPSALEPASVVPRAERGKSIVEELIADAEASKYTKRRFADVQGKASSGGKKWAKEKKRKREKS